MGPRRISKPENNGHFYGLHKNRLACLTYSPSFVDITKPVASLERWVSVSQLLSLQSTGLVTHGRLLRGKEWRRKPGFPLAPWLFTPFKMVHPDVCSLPSVSIRLAKDKMWATGVKALL